MNRGGARSIVLAGGGNWTEARRRTRGLACLLATLVSASLLAATPAPAAAPKAKRWATGRILVRPRAGMPAADFDNILKKYGGRTLRKIKKLKVHVLEVPPWAEDVMAETLAKNPYVEFAEKDVLMPLNANANDPRFADQWHLPKIQTPTAWDTSVGEGVIVAVLDTGVDASHPDLASKMVPGWNAYDDNSDTSDVQGHGTWVAGVLAAETDNGVGVASVAPRALIMPVRVAAPDGFALWSTVASAITWAADNGARVVNVSYDGVSESSTVKSAARYMRNKGGLVVVAAGNNGTQEPFAESPDLVAVSATTRSDARASFSSYGEYVDLAAPGAGIVTTSRGGGYSTVSGTSFASPCVAGVVALMMAANPALGPDQVESILFETPVDLGSLGWDVSFGFGRVDAAAAVQAAAAAGVPDTQAPSVTIASPTGGTVSGLVPVDVSATDDVGIVQVDLLVNGAFYASDTSEPFGFSWDSTQVADGAATLVAHAFDAAGNQGTSSTRRVTVDNAPEPGDQTPPTVTLTSPAAGITISRAAVVRVAATDDQNVTLVEALVDGEVVCATNLPTLSCVWDARAASPGAHTISARALDGAGNVGTDTARVSIGTKRRRAR